MFAKPIDPIQIKSFIRNGNLQEFKKLVTSNTANMKLDKNGLTLLHYVCMQDADRDEFAEHLLNNKADVNASFMGYKPIHMASVKEHPKLIKVLIEKGADFREKSSDGNSPFIASVELGLIENVRVLLQKGADVNEKNSDGYTALQMQCMSTDPTNKIDNMIQLLLDNRADPFIKGPDGLNSFVYAVNAGVNPTGKVKLIFEHNLANKDLLIQTNDDGLNAVFMACSLDNLELVKQLIGYGFSIEKTNDSFPEDFTKNPAIKQYIQTLRKPKPAGGRRTRRRTKRRKTLRPRNNTHHTHHHFGLVR